MTTPLYGSEDAGSLPGASVRDSIGAQVGSGNTQHFYGVNAAVTWPVRVGTVPMVADHYQDRDVSVAVEDSLDETGTVVLVPAATTIVAGMGGVGKTQIAAHHVRPLWQDNTVDVAVWVNATDRDAIVAAFAHAAHAVGNATTDDDPATAAADFLNWLATTARRWVIVADDLQAPDDMTGLWPPHTLTGHTVVTTRRRDAALQRNDRRIIEVTTYTPTESLSYLHAKFANNPSLLDGATELVEELHHLPIALAQAAAFMLEIPKSCRDYRTLFREGRDTEPDILPDEHQRTVDRTWEMSIDRANRLKPAGVARPLLELLALLDPNGIPSSLITSQPILTYLTDRTKQPVTVHDAERATSCLHRLSLAATDATKPYRGIRVHALVQHATSSQMAEAVKAATTLAAADALVAVWPTIERDSDLAQSLRTNAAALEDSTHPRLWRPDAHYVLFRYGKSLGEAGLVASAQIYFENLHRTATEKLGPDHSKTLTTRHDLARWRGWGGDVAGAITEYEQVLADRLRVLGPDHPSTLTTRSNLAYWRGEAGDVAGTVTEFEHLLADRSRVLGPDHPSTLTTRSNLARWRGEAGDVAGTVTEFEHLLADRSRCWDQTTPTP
jgi:hypothetical protein